MFDVTSELRRVRMENLMLKQTIKDLQAALTEVEYEVHLNWCFLPGCAICLR